MLQADVLLIIDSVDKLKDKSVFYEEKCRRKKCRFLWLYINPEFLLNINDQ